MQISFGNDIAQKDFHEVRSQRGYDSAKIAKAYGAGELSSVYEKGQSPMFLKDKKEKQDKLQQATEGSVEDFMAKQDYMTLMSNTLSEEDYAKLSEDGYDLQNMDPADTVTIVDKIKAEVAKSGKQVIGFTDTIDEATLTEAFGGNAGLAKEVMNVLQEVDVPVDQNTVAAISEAWDMTKAISVPSNGTIRYMIDNELEPQIQNLYMAKSSGAEAGIPGGAKYYAQDVAGYLAKSADSLQGLEDQLEGVITEAGLPVNETTRQEVEFLANQNLPITPEHLNRYHELNSIAFPVRENVFARAVGNALQKGIAPVKANLKDTDASLYEKAVSILNKYLNVEEVRLEMTAEVNVKLLKSGFSFDTASIEELIEGIKQAKEEIAQQYFPNQEESVAKYNLMQEVNEVVKELPTLPAITVMRTGFLEGSIPTVSAFEAEGHIAKQQYERAGESYEALMTSPRADLGDSIRKAFQNVDEILQEKGFSLTEENRQAVRVLGYNKMELTQQNIETVRGSLQLVKDVVNKMTPASTLQMIRDGINPLEKTFTQLRDYFAQRSQTFEEKSESYSKFLYAVEHHNEITPQERESFIGIYRLLHLIEKGDSAAIGAVVNMQGELSFSNLLSATRSKKASNMDIRMDEKFGGLKELIQNGSSISTQIDTAFLTDLQNALTDSMFGEEEAGAYRMEQYRLMREQTAVSQDGEAMLEEAKLPTTLSNLVAAGALLDGTGKPFGKLSKMVQWEKNENANLTNMEQELLDSMEDKDSFMEEYQETLSSVLETSKTLSMEAETYLDVKGLQMIHKQISIIAKVADSEEFWVPVELDGEVADVHMTLRHEEGKAGLVDMEIPYEDGKLTVHLEATDTTVRGYFAGSTSKEVMILEQVSDILYDWIREETSLRMDAKLPVVEASREMGYTAREKGDTETEANADTGSLYRLARGVLLATKRACILA